MKEELKGTIWIAVDICFYSLRMYLKKDKNIAEGQASSSGQNMYVGVNSKSPLLLSRSE